MFSMNAFRLDGKVALVTGACYGIGYAIAKALAQAGATIVFNARNAQAIEKALADYKADGIEAHGYVCDVTDEKAVDSLVKQIEEEIGTIDILVNNAGVSARDSFYDYKPEEFMKVIDLNLNSVFLCAQAAARIMKEQGGGVILNTSSMVSLYGQPAGVSYPASKFAVNGLTKSLARELGKDNIRVNAVAPGVTRTDMVAALPEEMVKRLTASIPLGRVGEPEDVANAFVFLASDMASYVTGEILSVDGAAMT